MPARKPSSRLKKVLWYSAAAGLLVLLTLIPYDVVRQERLRAFGEIETRGRVEERYQAVDQDGRTLCMLAYAWKDREGRVHLRDAAFGRDWWAALRVGDPITVHYARAQPDLARAQGELEGAFARRLREFLSE
ncbi:MAG: DUF3592 domain-containing protein [Desulfovibrionaceae bacterium]